MPSPAAARHRLRAAGVRRRFPSCPWSLDMSVSNDISNLPLSHLRVAGLAFDALTSEPRRLSLDCTELADRHGGELGLPDGPVLLSDLRTWLLEHPRNQAAV